MVDNLKSFKINCDRDRLHVELSQRELNGRKRVAIFKAALLSMVVVSLLFVKAKYEQGTDSGYNTGIAIISLYYFYIVGNDIYDVLYSPKVTIDNIAGEGKTRNAMFKLGDVSAVLRKEVVYTRFQVRYKVVAVLHGKRKVTLFKDLFSEEAKELAKKFGQYLNVPVFFK